MVRNERLPLVFVWVMTEEVQHLLFERMLGAGNDCVSQIRISMSGRRHTRQMIFTGPSGIDSSGNVKKMM